MRLWDVFLVHPSIALAIGLVFLFAAMVRGRRLSGVRRVLAIAPAAAWLAYGVYEWRMQSWSMTVVAPVRIDLLLLIPVLLIASGAGLAALVRPFHAS